MDGVVRLHSRTVSVGPAVDGLMSGAQSEGLGPKSILYFASCGAAAVWERVSFPTSHKALCSRTANPIACRLYPQVPRTMWYKYCLPS